MSSTDLDITPSGAFAGGVGPGKAEDEQERETFACTFPQCFQVRHQSLYMLPIWTKECGYSLDTDLQSCGIPQETSKKTFVPLTAMPMQFVCLVDSLTCLSPTDENDRPFPCKDCRKAFTRR